jgi:uncharacterized protein YbjQ (UPF0145 family)
VSIELIVFVVLLILGYLFGTLSEKRHYRSIKERERDMQYLPAIELKRALKPEAVVEYRLVNGSVVISIDYFKQFVASLINFFGGRVSVYETLIDRARREAILRMKEQAKDADEIINIRIETSSITKNTKSVGTIEVLSYGTAIYREHESIQP